MAKLCFALSVVVLAFCNAEDDHFKFSLTLKNFNSKGLDEKGTSCDWLGGSCDLGFNMCSHEYTGASDAANFSYCPAGYEDTGKLTKNGNTFTFQAQKYGPFSNPIVSLGTGAWNGMVVKVKAYDVDFLKDDPVDQVSIVLNSDLPMSQDSIIVHGTRAKNPSDLSYSAEVGCTDGYSSNRCQCFPRNDDFNGHFSCNQNGSIACIAHYYDVSTNCKVECFPDSHSPPHYTCDAVNGLKDCAAGYAPQYNCSQCDTGYYQDGHNCHISTTPAPTTTVPTTVPTTTTVPAVVTTEVPISTSGPSTVHNVVTTKTIPAVTTASPQCTGGPFSCSGKADGKYVVPGCPCSQKFIVCSNGDIYYFQCPASSTEPLVYDPVTQECNYKSNVTTCGSPDCTGINFKCDGNEGNVKDPLCPCPDYFFTCSNGKPYKFQCPASSTVPLVYDPTTGRCDYNYNVPGCAGQ